MKIHRTKAEAQRKYEKIAQSDLRGLGATRTNLRRLLKSIDLVGWSTHEESGRLDRRALTRFATGSAAIFSRRHQVEAEKAAVNILIDCSASMTFGDGATTRIDVAQEVAIHLSKILNSSGVDFSVTGFRSAKGGNKIDDATNNIIERSGYFRLKQWNESLNVAAAKLGTIDCLASGCTPDFSAIYCAIDELRLRPESKRILFLLTDADGYVQSNMQYLQKIADTNGIKLIAIGIESIGVTNCFRDAVHVDNIHQLTGTAFNHLLNNLRR